MYKYTAEELEQKYEEAILGVTQREWESWAHHPCATALKFRLMADQTGHFEDWINENNMPGDLAKWLIRRNEELLTFIFREGLFEKETHEENN